MKHYETKEKLEFKSVEELLEFLSYQNPLYMRHYQKEYQKDFPLYEILDFGKNVEIRKIKNKR